MLVDLSGVNRGKWNPIIHIWNENQVLGEVVKRNEKKNGIMTSYGAYKDPLQRGWVKCAGDQ